MEVFDGFYFYQGLRYMSKIIIFLLVVDTEHLMAI